MNVFILLDLNCNYFTVSDHLNWSLKFFKNVILFIFGCAGSFCWVSRGHSSWTCGPLCSGFSCCSVWALECAAFSSCSTWPSSRGSQALGHRLNSWGARVHLLHGMWDLLRPGIEPMSSALAGRFFTTEPPGKPCSVIFWKILRVASFKKKITVILDPCNSMTSYMNLYLKLCVLRLF